VKEFVMSHESQDASTTMSEDATGPLRHFRMDRRAMLQSLAMGAGAAVFGGSTALASGHAHHPGGMASGAAAVPTDAASSTSTLLFLDQHAFDTLSQLGEQIVPGSRAAQVPAFLDRLLFVESTETQKRFMQALGAFERVARDAHGKPWKMLTDTEATVLLTKMSALPGDDVLRRSFDALKSAVAESYYASEAGMKELGWNKSVVFAPPPVCS
jgi:Gluconate 2-dehydrogenase subunit 3